jgi:hypothetical protein
MNFNRKKSVCKAPEVLGSLKSYRSEKFENSNYTHTHTHRRALVTHFSANKKLSSAPFLIILCCLFFCASRLAAQVGIRTEDPQGMLHVDAKGDTYNGTDTLDDVVVTPQGRIGVGTLNPQARLHIVSPTKGAIRIADGTQSGGKILTSDKDGRAHWTSLVGSWYAALKEGSSTGDPTGSGTIGWPDFQYASYEEFSPGSVDLAAGSIEIPYTATYRVTVTGKGHTNRATTDFLVYLSIRSNGTLFFAPHQHSLKSFGALNFGFMTHVSLNANQKVTIESYRNNTSWANMYTDVMLHIELIR